MSNRDTGATWSYHNETKHSYQSVRSDLHYLDWSNQPIPFKIYPDIEPIALPRQWDETEMPALNAISETVHPGDRDCVPDLKDLAHILYCSAGITKRKNYPGGEIQFRAASCTGALYEIELYLACKDLPGLPAGVYHFSPKDFALRRLRQGDYRGVLSLASAAERAIAHAPIVIISTGTYWRNAWKYRARSYRHFGWDNGTILANLFATCSALRFPARLVLGFVDDQVNRLLDLDVEREVSLSLVALGWTKEIVPDAYPSLEALRLKTSLVSAREVDFPQMSVMHSATYLNSPEEVVRWRARTPTQHSPMAKGSLYKLSPFGSDELSRDTVEQVVLRRGSSRQFQRKPISFREFSTALYYSAQGIAADFLAPTLADTRGLVRGEHRVESGVLLNDWYLIINAVEGLPSGAYVLHRENWELELLKAGNLRNEAGYLGLEQELPADASANVFFLAHLEPVLENLGNRGYRAIQLEAGLLGGRLYLAAYAQRLGASGLTFYDDDVTRFFSPHAEGKSSIFLMALGRGKKRELVNL
jgi:SagB-type dehydrogenase family enzyme